MMHRLTNTHPRLQEQGPAWAALHPAPGDGPWGEAVAIWFMDAGSFQDPISGEGESVIDIPPKEIAPRNTPRKLCMKLLGDRRVGESHTSCRADAHEMH